MHIVDVAGYLARVVDEPRALGRRIDIGMDGALTFEDLGKLSSHLLDTPIKVRTIPWAPVNVAMKNGGVFSPGLRDFRPVLA
ncbi:MAG: hypothetical protein M3071_16130 [Actinomycetota bacterium]|nr:hypothetical protein [Actinomycetota bacterium]